MKLSNLVLAAASVAALSASASFAQDNRPMVGQSMATGKPVVMVPMTASAKDMYVASWVYRNLDDREVRRFRAQGFVDSTIKGAANIALLTGVPIEYVLRQVREVGVPLPTLATRWGVTDSQLNADIPGYGVEAIAITAPMGGMMPPPPPPRP